MIKKFNENWDTFEELNKKVSSEVSFNVSDYEITGLPSGQIIYMTNKQMSYFKSREFIRYIKVWKKPTSGGIIPIKIGKYCFEDTDYRPIMELMNTITW